MSYKHIFSLTLALILISLGVGFSHLFTFPDSAFPLQKGERINVLPGEVLTQTFASNRDGLQKIEILLGNFDLPRDSELILEVRDSSCDALIAHETLSGRSFDSEHTYSLLFDRIPDSGGKNYCFAAKFQSNQPVKKEKSPRFFVDEE